MRLNKFPKYLILIVGFLTIQSSHAQLEKHCFESLDSLQIIEERPVVAFFHTDWCKFCLAMESNVFTSDSVISKLNSEFYFVSFDAEEKEAITYKGKTYLFESNGVNSGTHQIATHYANEDGSVSFPAIVVLWKGKSIFQRNSFMDEEELLSILNRISSL
jgi:thioredoxin-related protein